MLAHRFATLASIPSTLLLKHRCKPVLLSKRTHRTWLRALASRLYPQEPRVGVGVIVFRPSQLVHVSVPDVLVVRRAKEPSKGKWSFPGETLVECALREVLEETGIRLKTDATNSETSLNSPKAFAAFDSITRDSAGKAAFHYVIVEVAAVAADPAAEPAPSDDVDAVKWVSMTELRSMANLTSQCVRLADEALQRFDLGFPHVKPQPTLAKPRDLELAMRDA